MANGRPTGRTALGVGLPNFGPHASPRSILTVASAAERLGLHSVWTFERLLLPVTPTGTNPYGLPEHNAMVYDPLETLTWIAAQTRRIGLGTIVMDPLFQSPLVLAKRMATTDQLSDGRLLAGIGQGWMPEEFASVGVPFDRRGKRFEEHIAAMRACWAPDPVEHHGPKYNIARSRIGPKPMNGRVPLLIGGIIQPAVERAARIGDGFAAVFVDWDTLRRQTTWYRGAGGRGPVVLRVNPEAVDQVDPHAPFTGTVPSVIDDLAMAAKEGVDVLVWDLNMANLDAHGQVARLEALTSALKA
jgi:probable F420-dependent oxidoreductase